MTDRFVVIAVTLLALIVMCALLLVAIVWVPAQINRLNTRLDQVEELSAKVSLMNDRLGELDKLEKRLGETTLAAAPLGRIDSSLDDVSRKLNDVVVPGVNDLKERAATRSDIDRIAGLVNQLSTKLAASSKDDPEFKKLAQAVEEIRSQVEATRKALDTSSRDLSADVKRIQLEFQRLENLLKPGGTGETKP